MTSGSEGGHEQVSVKSVDLCLTRDPPQGAGPLQRICPRILTEVDDPGFMSNIAQCVVLRNGTLR